MNPRQVANPFLPFWELGYQRLVPVVPVGAEISARSSLNRPGSVGKAVGVRGANGRWHGFDWVPYESSEADVARWHRMGADVGIKAGPQADGSFLVWIDADTHNREHARLIFDALEARWPGLPVRIGRSPKAMYPIRVSQPFRYARIEFGTRNDRGQLSDRCEILSAGKYAKVAGVHPDTMEPYRWTRPLVALADLPICEPHELTEFLEHLRPFLKAAPLVREGGTAEVNQDALRSDVQTVRAIVDKMPNMSEHFGTREAYRDMAYAIKASLPDDEAAAFSIFADWCSRWKDGENAEAVVESDFRRCRPPYRIGIGWLIDRAADVTGGAVTAADRFFDAEAAAGQPDTPSPSHGEGGGAVVGEVPPLRAGRVDPADLLELPPRQWLYGTKLSRRYVTFLASPGGVGKTAFVFAMALAAASAQALLHDASRKPLRIWIYNLEDDIVELRRRLAAAMRHYGLPAEVLDNIRLNSGRDRRFRIVQAREGQYVTLPDFRGVIDEMRREQIDVLVVDPYLRSHGVPENENEAQDEVMRLYADIAEATNAGVLLVHHTKKGAVAGEMDSLRGGSTQGGGARAAFTLAPMASDEAEKLGIPDEQRRLYVRLDDAKNNMAPPAQRAEWLKLEGVHLGNGDAEYPHGDSVQVATAWTPPTAWDAAEEGSEHKVLTAIAEGPGEGERFSIRPQDKDRWAGDVLIRLTDCTVGQAKATLDSWVKQGVLEVKDYASPSQRKSRKGVYVKMLSEVSVSSGSDGIFG